MRTSDVEENHTQQDQQQVDNLALKILLVENHGTEEEGNQHTTATYHRYDGNHGTVQTQGIEVHEIGRRKEHGNQMMHQSQWKGVVVFRLGHQRNISTPPMRKS